MRNLLNSALTLIRPVRFQYRIANDEAVTDQFGRMSASYGAWTGATGMVEPGLVSSFGSKNLSDIEYKDLGFDPAKKSITVWVKNAELKTTAGRETCDQVKYRDRVYNILNIEDWLEYDGWKRCYCQEIIGFVEAAPSEEGGGE